MQMADKHDAAPTAVKPPKEFRETVKIGSASSWDKNIVSLFHVSFDRAELSNLRNFLDVKHFQLPSIDDETHKSTFQSKQY